MSSKEMKAAIVSELNLMEWQVSVRRQTSSLECIYRVHVSLADEDVSTSQIEAIANRWANIKRCEAPGEAQAGGTLVYVSCERFPSGWRNRL